MGDYAGWLQLLRADGWQDQIRHLQCRRNRMRCDHPVCTIRYSGFWLGGETMAALAVFAFLIIVGVGNRK